MALDINNKTFVMYVAIRKQEKMLVYFKIQAQVEALIFNKAPIEVPAEYSNYSNVFSAENAVELLENTEMNEYAIKLKKGKYVPFGPIYRLKPAKLEILKTYIKIYLANSFIRPSKSPIKVFILFDRKPDRNLYFCRNY